MILSALDLDAVTIAFALLGGAFGLFMGEKLRQYSPTASSAPGLFCFLGAVFSACFAYVVLFAVICIAVLLVIAFLLWHLRPFLIVQLQDAAGWLSALYQQRHGPRIFQRKIAIVHREHRVRVQSILAMDLTDQQRARFLEDEERRYQDELRDSYKLNP